MQFYTRSASINLSLGLGLLLGVGLYEWRRRRQAREVSVPLKSAPKGWDFDTMALVSRSLDEVGIPSVLWGNRLISLYGVPTIVNGLSFIVPDEQLADAVSTLLSVGFKACDDPECSATATDRVSPGPPAHLHLPGEADVLELHKHSATLWRVISLNPSELGPEADIMYASDPVLPPSAVGAGCGAMPFHLYPVRIPSIHRYAEAVILLDVRHLQERQAQFWAAMLTYIEEYIVPRGTLKHQLLPNSMQRYLRDLETGDVKLKTAIANLQKDLEVEEGTAPEYGKVMS